MRTVGLWLLLAIPARLCAQGSYLSYSTYLGGGGEDIIHAVATDSAGNVYLAGETTSSNFPVTAGALQTKRGNPPGTVFGFEGQYLPNAFVAKLNPAGQILWSTYLGGSGADAALGIAVDANGSPYVLGYSYSPDFPTTRGAYQTTAPLSNRAFVAKFTPDGSSRDDVRLFAGRERVFTGGSRPGWLQLRPQKYATKKRPANHNLKVAHPVLTPETIVGTGP
jgi:hypothetical protein